MNEDILKKQKIIIIIVINSCERRVRFESTWAVKII